MKCTLGIDLGSTTTKAVLLDEAGAIVGKGITNSRSNYETACAVARLEAITATRFEMLERELAIAPALAALSSSIREAYRLEQHLLELEDLGHTIRRNLSRNLLQERRDELLAAVDTILEEMRAEAPSLFLGGAPRRSDFFRDLAGAAYISRAETLAKTGLPFEPLAALYDRAILEVETRVVARDTAALLERAARRVSGDPRLEPLRAGIEAAIVRSTREPIEELAVVGTGYGRQTLPFPRESVRSEILCHGRGAHRVFPGTRTVLDIGGQDTKAIQVDGHGVVTSFQMNDRCAAGCGRYLGYIADELNLGLHELGPLALQSKKSVKVCSTCTVFAGAELRERLALGQRREDILAGLHRAIMLRSMSLLARSGGVSQEFTFTGGVCKNGMATKVLRELVDDNYGRDITLNAHPDSIFMGALGAALFGLDDVREGTAAPVPAFARSERSEARA